jgi:predicted acetyltransferase
MFATPVPFERYDHDRHRADGLRIWREVGWLRKDQDAVFDTLIPACRGHVALVDGNVECLVASTDGRMSYQRDELPMSCCTAVTSGLVARRQGLAGRLLAHTLVEEVAAGAIVGGLGVFDQGFYDRVGYATGTYSRRTRFDPARLRVDEPTRRPLRLTSDDLDRVHANRLSRFRAHGGICIDTPAITQADGRWIGECFGLGFEDDAGRLTHHMWIHPMEAEHGPYAIWWMAYETGPQLLELLGALKSLSDQVHGVSMADPPGVLLQTLLDAPSRTMQMTAGAGFEAQVAGWAGWQTRILDLPACMQRLHLETGEVRCNVMIDDPIEPRLDDAAWRGCGGSYIVHFGADSFAEQGEDAGLPTMRCSIGAFTRLWLGVSSASALTVTHGLQAPDELLARLDDVVRLPLPCPDWDY